MGQLPLQPLNRKWLLITLTVHNLLLLTARAGTLKALHVYWVDSVHLMSARIARYDTSISSTKKTLVLSCLSLLSGTKFDFLRMFRNCINIAHQRAACLGLLWLMAGWILCSSFGVMGYAWAYCWDLLVCTTKHFERSTKYSTLIPLIRPLL